MRVVVGGGAARLPVEGQVDAARHVRRGHGGADEPDDHERAVAALARAEQDLVLRPEAGQRWNARERQRRDQERPERDRHVVLESTHVLLHVEGVVRAGVGHRAGAEEQAGLEERMREEVEDAGGPCADAEGHHHVAELAHGGVGEHLLDVVLHERQGARR